MIEYKEKMFNHVMYCMRGVLVDGSHASYGSLEELQEYCRKIGFDVDFIIQNLISGDILIKTIYFSEKRWIAYGRAPCIIALFHAPYNVEMEGRARIICRELKEDEEASWRKKLDALLDDNIERLKEKLTEKTEPSWADIWREFWRRK